MWLYTYMYTLGEEVGFYFGWMCFYSKFISAPLVIGLAMYVLRPRGITVDTDPYLPFFSIVMALWGVLFVVVSSVCCGVLYTHTQTGTAIVASIISRRAAIFELHKTIQGLLRVEGGAVGETETGHFVPFSDFFSFSSSGSVRVTF